jgi:hypothetical protein
MPIIAVMPITLAPHDVPNEMMALVTGEVGVSEILEFASVERSGEHRAWALIFDASEGIVNVTTADVQRLAGLATQDGKGPPIGPVVIIASTPATFGLSRMFQSYSHIAGRKNVGVVRSMEEAQSWLAANI